MKLIHAQELTHSAFDPFGDYWPAGDARTGSGYAFSSHLYPTFRGGPDEEPSLGITLGESLATSCSAMERHFHTSETLFGFSERIILAVAPPGGTAPEAAQVVAFVINPGDVVRLRRGVWHDACRGVDTPVTYGWLADCRAPLDPWISVAGGPIRVTMPV